MNVGEPQQLFVSPDTRITCPKCQHDFGLAEGFARQALEQLERASDSVFTELRATERVAVENQAQRLADDRERTAKQEIEALKKLIRDRDVAHARQLEEMRALEKGISTAEFAQLQQLLTERDAALAAMKGREAELATQEREFGTRVAQVAKVQAKELFAIERQAFEGQLKTQSELLQSLRAKEVELLAEKQRIADERSAIELEVARKLDAGRTEHEARVRAQERERSSLEKSELQKTIDDMSGKLAEAQRKAEQGSQQLQGEVLELAIEEGLRREFLFDVIEEVKKGQRGGDVIQRVGTRTGQVAGVILWETKRAKDWSPQWIKKLKEDMRRDSADIGVLVTMPSAVPSDWTSAQLFGLFEDVWVTTWSTALELADVLRAGLIDVYKQRIISAGKGEKMEALYDYLTSPQFAQKLKAVYGAFRTLQEDLQKERAGAEQRFSRREKQIATGVKELLGVAGDVQGLAQQELPMLELEKDAESNVGDE